MRISRATGGVKCVVWLLGRRSTGVGMRGEVLDRMLPRDAVNGRPRIGGGSTPSSWLRREAQNFRSLSRSWVFVWPASVGGLIIRARFAQSAIGAISASRAGTVASSFSASADKPIEFILRQNKNGAIRQRDPTMEDRRYKRGCVECL